MGNVIAPVVVATGFRREAGCLPRRAGLVPVVGGGDPVALRRRVEAAASGASGIASFGMAGALADGLAVGDWIIGDRLHGATALRCDPIWGAALTAILPGARIADVHADGRMIRSPEEKRAIARDSGAMAVDMESHIAAAVAVALGLPFVVVRCVSDDADRALPEAVAASMRADGGVAVGKVIASLARRPAQFADLVRTTAGFVTAWRSLRRHGAAIGAVLARPPA